jgi:signal transduction histidine kinase
VEIRTVTHPLRDGELVRLRSEVLPADVTLDGRGELVCHIAVSTQPLEATLAGHLRDASLTAFAGLCVVFLLVWIVTTRTLEPVARMTERAATISSSKLRERLPLSGTNDEFDRLARVLNAMLERLQHSMEQMEAFTADAAHQLRTPLTRIRGELDLVLRGEVPDAQRSPLRWIQEELERLSHTCGRLLLLAQLDRQLGGTSPFTDDVDLAQLVHELVEQVSPIALDKGVSLRLEAAAPVSLHGSKHLIAEALLNLLDNAIRFSGRGGVVEVALLRKEHFAVLAIRDSGPGIPAEERERIFQRFYRIDRAGADPEPGAGLGLSIVKGIALAHGGQIEVDSVPGRSSCFRLILPAA